MSKQKAKSTRQKRIEELIRQIAGELLAKETNRTSLITITRVDISPDLANCLVFFTVFPTDAQESALNFLKRKRTDLKQAVKKASSLRRIPFFDFEVDYGEKNRQLIDELSAKH